jgi:hypothetical protein
LNREAWRAIEKEKGYKYGEINMNCDRGKVWLCSGKDLFIKLPKDKSRKIIEQGIELSNYFNHFRTKKHRC